MHIHMHTQINTHTQTDTHSYTHIIHTYTQTLIHTRTHTKLAIYTNACCTCIQYMHITHKLVVRYTYYITRLAFFVGL